MTSPMHFTIVPGALGSEHILIKLYAEEMVTWTSLSVLTSAPAGIPLSLDEDGVPMPLIQVLYGTLLIFDSGGNSRPGSGVPVVLALYASMTRSSGMVGI